MHGWASHVSRNAALKAAQFFERYCNTLGKDKQSQSKVSPVVSFTFSVHPASDHNASRARPMLKRLNSSSSNSGQSRSWDTMSLNTEWGTRALATNRRTFDAREAAMHTERSRRRVRSLPAEGGKRWVATRRRETVCEP